MPRGCLKILCRFSFCADYISLHLTYPPIKTPVTTRPRSRSVWGWGFAARAFQNHLLTWQARAFQRDSKGIYRIQAHLPSPFLLLSRSGCKRVRWLQFLPVYQKITSSSCRLRRGGWRFQRHCCLEKVVHRHSQVLQEQPVSGHWFGVHLNARMYKWMYKWVTMREEFQNKKTH